MDTDCTVPKLKRLPIIFGIVLLHVGAYYAVNSINSQRPLSVFVNLYTSIDSWVPFVNWTWTVYYFGDVYITIWAFIIVWRLSDTEFKESVYAYAGMIFFGAFLQLLIPGKAPWPHQLDSAQAFMHNLISMKPYACLPSMHVALTVFPACLLFSVFKSTWIRILSTSLAFLITISILTLKEHFFLDAVTGALLGLIFFGLWCVRLKKVSQSGQ